MWGIIPAAGRGSRIKPLAFSKELLPVGSRLEGGGERPMAVSEYLVERMLGCGVKKLCFVISAGKSDIVEYYGGRIAGADICYVVQDEPKGLCDALFRALPFVADDEWVFVGLPDTIWFPENALSSLDGEALSFLLFPVERPELFDAVELDDFGNVLGIEVKASAPSTHWVWGAFKLRGSVLRELHGLWREPGRGDEYIGTLVNAYILRGGRARGLCAGRSYADVGTLNGYREACRLLETLKYEDPAQRQGGLVWSKRG
jgi:dTDP-glucose pyrophosphorylase